MTDIYYWDRHRLSVARQLPTDRGLFIAIRDDCQSFNSNRCPNRGAVFPLPGSRLWRPALVERFIGKFDGLEPKHLFAICTCEAMDVVNAVLH